MIREINILIKYLKKIPYQETRIESLRNLSGYLLLTHPLGVTNIARNTTLAYRGLIYESIEDLKNNNSSYRTSIELPISYSRSIPCYSLFHKGKCIAKPHNINDYFPEKLFTELSIQIDDPTKSQIITVDKLFPERKTLGEINLPAVLFEEGFSVKGNSDKPSKIVFYSYELLRSIILTHSEMCKIIFSGSFIKNEIVDRLLHLKIKEAYEKKKYNVPFLVIKQKYLLKYKAVKDTLMLLLFDKKAQKEVVVLYNLLCKQQMKKFSSKKEGLQNYPTINYPLSSKAHFDLIGKMVNHHNDNYFLVHQITGITGAWPYESYGEAIEVNFNYTGSDQIDLPIGGFKAKRNIPDKEPENDKDKDEEKDNNEKTPPIDPRAKAPKDASPIQIEDENIFKDRPESKRMLKPVKKDAKTKRNSENPKDADKLALITVSGEGDEGAKEATTSQQTENAIPPQERKRLNNLSEILKMLETRKNIFYSFRVVTPAPTADHTFFYSGMHFSRFKPDNDWAKGEDGKGRPVLIIELDISFYSNAMHPAKAYLIDPVNYFQETTRRLLLAKKNLEEIEINSFRNFLKDASYENCVWEVFFKGKKQKMEYKYYKIFFHHKFNHKETESDEVFQQAWVEKIERAIKEIIDKAI